MKRYIVDQIGFVQVEATRRFVVEVPNDISEEEAQQLLEEGHLPLPEGDGMEWWDTPDRKWLGYEVEIEDIEVYDPETVMGTPSTDGLRVVWLQELKGEVSPE